MNKKTTPTHKKLYLVNWSKTQVEELSINY